MPPWFDVAENLDDSIVLRKKNHIQAKKHERGLHR
jgi:hypothetical protein